MEFLNENSVKEFCWHVMNRYMQDIRLHLIIVTHALVKLIIVLLIPSQTVSLGEKRSIPNRATILYKFKIFDCALYSYLSKGNFMHNLVNKYV